METLILQKIVVATAIMAFFVWIYKEEFVSKNIIEISLVSIIGVLIAIILLLMFFY